MIRSFRFALTASVLLLAAGCGGPTMEKRLPFQPELSVPYCQPTPGHPDPASAWEEFQRSRAALAADLGTRDIDTAVLLDRLRAAIIGLAEEEGCRPQYAVAEGGAIQYDLRCDGLTGAKELARQHLEEAVRTRFPPLIAAANRYLDACPNTWTAFAVKLHAADVAQGWASPEERRHAALTNQTVTIRTAGCSYQNVAPCQRACDRGDAEACDMVSLSNSSSDPEAAHAAVLRACEARLANKDPKAGSTCYLAGMNRNGSPSSLSNKLLDEICAAMPLDNSCLSLALNPKAPSYDLERARRVVAAIDACSEPTCPKIQLQNREMPHYNVGAARRANQWFAAECAAHRVGCGQAFGALTTDAPHFDRKIGREIVEVMAQMCAGTVKIESLPGYLFCPSVFFVFSDGFAPDPARAYEIAKSRSEGPQPTYQLLATCYESGKCGRKKNQAQARLLWNQECAATLATLPTLNRSGVWACKKADGVAP